MSLGGHLWTIGPVLAARLRPPRVADSEPWGLELRDPEVGSVRLTGWLRRAGDGGRVAVLLHGLGGSAESPYLAPLSARLAAAGWSSLRLNLRGADRRGDDVHHAGWTADLPAVFAAAPLADARRLALLGVSLGGHVALRHATEPHDARLAAVVSICAPLDLERGAAAIDSPRRALYRRHVLRGLKEIYAEVGARRPVPVPVERVERARRIREWDGLVVAPRFGFRSAEDYYARASVAPRLGALAAPALLIWSEGDPMVPAETVRPCLSALSGSARVIWTPAGGHVGFPANLDLGLGPEPGLAGQVVSWLEAVAPAEWVRDSSGS